MVRTFIGTKQINMNLIPFKSPEDLWSQAVQMIKSLSSGEGVFRMGASGGSSAKIFDKLLEADVDISNFEIYLIDERFVSYRDKHSNYRLIAEKIKGTGAALFDFDTSLSIEDSLLDYVGKLPESFDLTIFGMGPDGHTASLFPHQKSLQSEYLVEHTTTDVFDIYDRLTLTFKALERSKRNLILATGESKRPVIEALKDPLVDAAKYPIARIAHLDESVLFYAP